MTKELPEKSKEEGLKINMKKNKTRITGNGIKKNLEIERETMEEIDEMIYLRQRIPFKNRARKELAKRLKSGERNFWRLR